MLSALGCSASKCQPVTLHHTLLSNFLLIEDVSFHDRSINVSSTAADTIILSSTSCIDLEVISLRLLYISLSSFDPISARGAGEISQNTFQATDDKESLFINLLAGILEIKI
jgi:hypothetical protein